MEALVAGISRPSSCSVKVAPHGFQVLGDEGDAVGLFDAEFAGVADGDSVDGVGCDGGEDREFVDDLSGERSADVHAAGAAGGAVDLNGADEFAVVLFDVEDFYFSAKRGDDVE